jgi:hypothetical protein
VRDLAGLRVQRNAGRLLDPPRTPSRSTYSTVWFTGDDDEVMTLSASDHQALDPYFPPAGGRASASVGTDGRLVVTYRGPFATISRRSTEANTYCGRSTAPGVSCGA